MDGVEEQFSYTHSLHINEVRLEQSLRSLEPLAAHFNHPTVRQLDPERKSVNAPSVNTADALRELCLHDTLLPSDAKHKSVWSRVGNLFSVTWHFLVNHCANLGLFQSSFWGCFHTWFECSPSPCWTVFILFYLTPNRGSFASSAAEAVYPVA